MEGRRCRCHKLWVSPETLTWIASEVPLLNGYGHLSAANNLSKVYVHDRSYKASCCHSDCHLGH